MYNIFVLVKVTTNVNCIINVQLVDMQWKLSFATCSSRCPNMNTPLVTIKLTIALPNGSTTDKCFELEIAEFKVINVQDIYLSIAFNLIYWTIYEIDLCQFT